MAAPQTPPGWYPTPDGTQRYWDGTRWTENVAPAAPMAAAPAAPAPAPATRGGALKWVLLAMGLVLVLGVGSCIAIVATAGNEVSKALKSVSTDLGTSDSDTTTVPGTSDGSGDQDNPVVITEGNAFDVRNFAYAKGWTIENGDFGMGINNLKVTNNRAEKDAAIIDIKFWKGTEVLATVTCTSDQIMVGTTVTLNCFSGDKLPKGYDKITVNDTF